MPSPTVQMTREEIAYGVLSWLMVIVGTVAWFVFDMERAAALLYCGMCLGVGLTTGKRLERERRNRDV